MEHKKGNRFKDLTNIRFGKLLAIKPIKKHDNSKYYWECICDCGNTKIIMSSNLLRGISTTCGCGKIKIGEKTRKHGMAKTRIFKIWAGIRKRCTNSKCKTYPLYGGRGISISPRWDEFINFYNDMKDGYSDNLSLDRINPNGNYEPGNCRWATQKTQNRNRRNNNYISLNNEIKTLSEWAEISGVNSSAIRYRINNGWDTQKAIFTSTEKEMKSISKYLVF
jgi:hypothetical protein